jgi:hypothetical protein
VARTAEIERRLAAGAGASSLGRAGFSNPDTAVTAATLAKTARGVTTTMTMGRHLFILSPRR